MLRVAIISTFLFLSVSTGILYYQWDHYEKQEKANTVLEHEIDAQFLGKELVLEHRVKGASLEKYTIHLPDRLKQFTCGKKKECVVRHENGKTIIQFNKMGEAVLSYRISIGKRIDPLWLEKWFITFDTVQPQHIYVQLTDGAHQRGTWVAGASLIGQVQKKTFSFYMWEQKSGNAFPLYFQSVPLQRKHENGIDLYTTKQNQLDRSLLSFLQARADIQTIVVTPFSVEYVTPTFLVISENVSHSSLKTKYANVYLRERFPNSSLDEWIWELLASLMTKQLPASAKAKAAFNELQTTLTAEELHSFWKEIKNKQGQSLSKEKLDHILGDVYGGNTTFFVENGQELVFTEEKALFVNNHKLENAKVLMKNGEQLIPFTEVMKTLGYTLKRSGNALFIEKNGQRWRFFIEPIEPNNNAVIRQWNGKLYIERTTFPKWFDVYVSETSKEIHVIGQ
jgi:hypothetical protein